MLNVIVFFIVLVDIFVVVVVLVLVFLDIMVDQGGSEGAGEIILKVFFCTQRSRTVLSGK